MKRVPAGGKVRVTYLEMTAPPRDVASSAPPGVSLERVERADLAQYRALYRRVGDPWQWVARRMLDEAALRAVFEEPRYELWHAIAVPSSAPKSSASERVVSTTSSGAPIGFAELDRTQPPDVEIRYFGLIEEWIGRGAGRWFLRAMIDRAWAEPETARVWLHTCELDHPGALRFYQRGGLVTYGEGVEDYVDPDTVSRW
jgi:GNAT superfamily N-acetyltransferase